MTTNTKTGATPASVARTATQTGALAAGETALIGLFGTSGNQNALVRLANGRVLQVKPGDRVDTGVVVAIDEDGLIVQKNGETRRIGMPGG